MDQESDGKIIKTIGYLVDSKNNFPRPSTASRRVKSPNAAKRHRHKIEEKGDDKEGKAISRGNREVDTSANVDLRPPEQRLNTLLDECAWTEHRYFSLMFRGDEGGADKEALKLVEQRSRCLILYKICQIAGSSGSITSGTKSLLLACHKGDLALAYHYGQVWEKSLQYANWTLQECEALVEPIEAAENIAAAKEVNVTLGIEFSTMKELFVRASRQGGKGKGGSRPPTGTSTDVNITPQDWAALIAKDGNSVFAFTSYSTAFNKVNESTIAEACEYFASDCISWGQFLYYMRITHDCFGKYVRIIERRFTPYRKCHIKRIFLSANPDDLFLVSLEKLVSIVRQDQLLLSFINDTCLGALQEWLNAAADNRKEGENTGTIAYEEFLSLLVAHEMGGAGGKGLGLRGKIACLHATMLIIAGYAHTELGNIKYGKQALSAAQDELQTITGSTVDSEKPSLALAPVVVALKRLVEVELKIKNTNKVNDERRRVEEWLTSTAGRKVVMDEAVGLQEEQTRLDPHETIMSLESAEQLAIHKILTERMKTVSENLSTISSDSLMWTRNLFTLYILNLGRQSLDAAVTGVELARLMIRQDEQEESLDSSEEEYQKIIQLLDSSLAIFLRSFGGYCQRVATTATLLAESQRKMNQVDKAATNLYLAASYYYNLHKESTDGEGEPVVSADMDSIRHYKLLTGEDALVGGKLWLQAATAYRATSQKRLEMESLERAITLFRAVPSDGEVRAAHTSKLLGDALLEQEAYGDALNAYKYAKEVFVIQYGPKHDKVKSITATINTLKKREGLSAPVSKGARKGDDDEIDYEGPKYTFEETGDYETLNISPTKSAAATKLPTSNASSRSSLHDDRRSTKSDDDKGSVRSEDRSVHSRASSRSSDRPPYRKGSATSSRSSSPPPRRDSRSDSDESPSPAKKGPVHDDDDDEPTGNEDWLR